MQKLSEILKKVQRGGWIEKLEIERRVAECNFIGRRNKVDKLLEALMREKLRYPFNEGGNYVVISRMLDFLRVPLDLD